MIGIYFATNLMLRLLFIVCEFIAFAGLGILVCFCHLLKGAMGVSSAAAAACVPA